MSSVGELVFDERGLGTLLLPPRCVLDVSCWDEPEIQQAVALSLKELLFVVASVGTDLSGLDGITVCEDCSATASRLQNLPPGQVALDSRPQPESLDLARTVAVRTGDEYRFHIVLRKGLALASLSPDPAMQQVAQACIAHEGAHVEHESHLNNRFPELLHGTLDCGERSRHTFLKAVDVWSEYAACRAAALFRPEALAEFEDAACYAVADCPTRSRGLIRAYRDGREAKLVFHDLQQLFGDTFIYAGYLLGHLHGSETNLTTHLSHRAMSTLGRADCKELLLKLERSLRELWLKEFAWPSVEVFAPIYDLICEMMAHHGVTFTRNEDEWRIAMYDVFEA